MCCTLGVLLTSPSGTPERPSDVDRRAEGGRYLGQFLPIKLMSAARSRGSLSLKTVSDVWS